MEVYVLTYCKGECNNRNFEALLTLLFRCWTMLGWIRRLLLQLIRGRTRAAVQLLSGAEEDLASVISSTLHRRAIRKLKPPGHTMFTKVNNIHV